MVSKSPKVCDILPPPPPDPPHPHSHHRNPSSPPGTRFRLPSSLHPTGYTGVPHTSSLTETRRSLPSEQRNPTSGTDPPTRGVPPQPVPTPHRPLPPLSPSDVNRILRVCTRSFTELGPSSPTLVTQTLPQNRRPSCVPPSPSFSSNHPSTRHQVRTPLTPADSP